MRKLSLLFIASFLFAQTPPVTPNIGLYIPLHGSLNWDTWYNANWSTEDLILAGFHNLKSYGAIGNGIADDSVALKAAVTAGVHMIYLPAGTYSFNNASAAVILSGFNGIIQGDGNNTIISCTSLSNPCLEPINSTGLILAKFSLMFAPALSTCNPSALNNCTSVRNGSQALEVINSTNVRIDNVYIHDGPSSGILSQCNSHVTISNSRVSNMWANAYFITNSNDVHLLGNSSDNTQDADIEFSQYDYVTCTTGATSTNATVDGFSGFQDFGGPYVNSYSNVTITNFTIANTWVGGIAVGQDLSTSTTHWPDQVHFSNGIITNPGIINPANSNVRALSINTFTTTPATGFLSHIFFDHISTVGGNASAIAAQFGTGGTTNSYYDLNLVDIAVDKSLGACFDFNVAFVTAAHLACTRSSDFAFAIRTATQFIGNDLRAYDDTGESGNVLFNVSTGTVLLNGVNLTSDLTPSHVGFYDAAASGVHVFQNLSLLTGDGTNPTITTSGATVYSSGNTNGVAFSSAGNFTTITGSGALTVGGAVTLNGPNLKYPGIKSTTGQRFVCVDSNGYMISSVTACSGT